MDVQPKASKIRRERGFAPLELALGIFFITVLLVLALQLFSAIYTAQAAGRAVWDAARAQSLGQSAAAAASDSLPGSVQLMSVRSLGDGVEIRVRPPQALPWPRLPDITRKAYVP